jgi:aryl sulfotransferase
MSLRYTSADEDSARWDAFEVRDGDLVVSTRSKHGTTWMQTILLSLIHGPPPFPAPLGQLSPWLDHLVEPLDVVLERLQAQPHRRVIKTHTPLDGIPLDVRATYIVVARHPLDAAVSLYHQGDNIDGDRLRELTGTSADDMPAREQRPPLRDWLSGWIAEVADPMEALDSLDGVLHHLADAWTRRHDPNVVLVRFEDLRADTAGQMRLLARRLGLAPPAGITDDLVAAVSFDAMRNQAEVLAPNAQGVLRDPRAFFRQGRSGEGIDVASPEDLQRYHRRLADRLDPELIAWLHDDA